MIYNSISIITATFNSESTLPVLIESLRNQVDKDFEWIVADGGSSDKTLDILKAVSDINIKITSQTDFGIYDALNRAIKISNCEYYLVVGSDDYLYQDSVKHFRIAAQQTSADIIAAGVDTLNGSLAIHEGKGWMYGAHAYIAAHSVGTLIRRSLHEQFGLYSKHLSITADSLFIKQACQAGARRHRANFISGFFSTEGTSNTNKLTTLVNGLHMQLITEKYKVLQIILFLIRFLKNNKYIS